MQEPGGVSSFFNFGNDPAKQRIGRKSKYFEAWTLANGEMPKKGQAMSPEVFLDGQFFWVMVEDLKNRADGGEKDDSEVYSRITKFLSVERP